MSLTRLLVTIFSVLASTYCEAQVDSLQETAMNGSTEKSKKNNSKKTFHLLEAALPGNFLLNNSGITITDSGVYLTRVTRRECKHYFTETFFYSYPTEAAMLTKAAVVVKPVAEQTRKIKLLTIHGNVSYDYFYRSAIDTPIAQKDFQQHTERVYLDVLYKEKYPLKVNFIARQSNSPYFRNFIDLNFQFDKYAYNKNLKQQLLNKLNTQLPQLKYPDLSKVESELKKLTDQYNKTKKWLEDPATLQKLIEEREKGFSEKKSNSRDSAQGLIADQPKETGIYRLKDSAQLLINKAKGIKDKVNDSLMSFKTKVLNKKDSIVGDIRSRIDSIAEPFVKVYEKKKQQLDSLEKKVALYKNKADSIKGLAEKNVTKLRQKIYAATSEKELRKLAAENGIETNKQGKLEKQLAAIKTFSIGRSILNYTELTAQNITVTGINLEYNPGLYAAFAAGKIDYRFRDFLNRNTARHNNQYIVMGRLGIGNKEHTALILSYFTGRKNTAQFSLSDSIKSYVNIMGYSLEAIYKKDENTSISAEFAKSTKPVTGSLQSSKQTGVLWNYSDRSNMGINIKAQTIIPETNTRLSGFYRKTGEHFQSFSLFSYNTDQTAWLARADQSFLKNKITLTGMLRRNDFTNPFTDKTYKTSTVFKSVLLNIRFPKYPSVSIGYYPGTQLYLVNKEKIRESAYYILNGSVVYSYKVRGISMNSSFVYNRYTNEATDSGFIAYKGVNYYGSQTLLLKKLQVQGGYAYSKQPQLQFYTIETSADYALRNWLSVGAGVKYNDISGGNNYWGERLLLSVGLKQFGTVQLQYDKSYLPTISQTLYPVEIGRISYYKNF
jgi:rRNA processing protein Gar1